MSSLPRTSKRLPPHVYRRRRIAALLVLVVLVALVWAGVTAIGSWLAGGSTQTPLPDDMNESSVVVESGEACPPGTVSVQAVVGNANGEEQLAFSADEIPYVWFTLTNTNTVDCTFNAGAKVQFFNITSGEQLIWTSKQCDRTGLEDANIVLPVAETMPSTPQPWEKVFSSDGGCGAEQSPVITDGASYVLDVEVNGELSTNSVQFVLN